jgi:hypothetical protein
LLNWLITAVQITISFQLCSHLCGSVFWGFLFPIPVFWQRDRVLRGPPLERAFPARVEKKVCFFPFERLPKEVGTKLKSNIRILEMWVLAGFLFPSIEFCVSLTRRLSPSGCALEVPNSPSGNAKPNLGLRNYYSKSDSVWHLIFLTVRR